MSRILLAEDDRTLRDITVRFLSKNGLDVDVTDNGNEACTLIEKNKYDCIVLDIMMPGKSGWDVCKFIRNKYDVPVIFLTALGDETDIVTGYEIGADEYMVKPFSLKVLYAKCLALLNRTDTGLQKEIVLECSGIKLYPMRMEVEAEGKKIILAPKEYFLLKVLMENKGMVLGRERLLDLVWGIGFDGSDRVVDNHIKKLRKNLGKPGEAIKTVIGGGYKIV
jgi:DNA-binding response OmpR family regulator